MDPTLLEKAAECIIVVLPGGACHLFPPDSADSFMEMNGVLAIVHNGQTVALFSTIGWCSVYKKVIDPLVLKP